MELIKFVVVFGFFVLWLFFDDEDFFMDFGMVDILVV